MRKLAHIEIIESLHPIEKADKIEMVKVLGWQCVVAKGEFKVGQKIIYIEIDSIVPDKPEFEFLKDRKFRVKTIKLRGQISQGLIIPLPHDWTVKRDDRCIIGSDVTEELGITKYISKSEQNEIFKQKIAHHWTKKYGITKWLWKYKWFRNLVNPIKKKDWPKWVSKTDEDRIQNMPSILKYHADKIVEVTEKIDYQSATFTIKRQPWFKKSTFLVCSRNLINTSKTSLYWRISEKYGIKKLFKEIMRDQWWSNFTIQGEQGGPGVQSNKYKLEEHKFFVFNLIRSGKITTYKDMKDFCDYNKLDIVPFVKRCKLSSLGTTVDELVKFSEGKSQLNPKIQREGIVVKCIEDKKKLFSFKVVNPKFLLKYE